MPHDETKAITSTTLRQDLDRYLDAVSRDQEVLIIPHDAADADAVVMLPISGYNSPLETEHLLSTEANREDLRASLRELDDGDRVTVESP